MASNLLVMASNLRREREREREGENTYNPSTISSCFRPKDLCLSGPDIRWIPSTSDPSAGRLLIPTLHIAWCHQLHQEVCEHMSMNACNNYIGTRHRHMAPGVACQYFANESHLDLAQRFSEQLNSLGFHDVLQMLLLSCLECLLAL